MCIIEEVGALKCKIQQEFVFCSFCFCEMLWFDSVNLFCKNLELKRCTQSTFYKTKRLKQICFGSTS